MKKTLLLLAAVLPCVAAAQTVGVHLLSHHFPEQAENNDVNVGVYVKTAGGWTAGGYWNTLRRVSLYGGYTWEYGPFSLTAGLISGYQRRDGRGVSSAALVPFATPGVVLPEVAGWRPRLTLVPGVRGMESVLHLSVEKTIP